MAEAGAVAEQPAVPQPAAVAQGTADAAVPCPAPFGLAEPVLFPAMIDGTLVLSAPLCQGSVSEPVDACSTSYYFYEPDRLYCCYLPL